MNRDVAEKWITALRSGEYKQASGCLTKVHNTEEYHCCLGVLCVILNMPRHFDDIDSCMAYGAEHNTSYLPWEAMKKAGMCTTTGVYEGRATLADLNDNGKSFAEIADVIEANIHNL